VDGDGLIGGTSAATLPTSGDRTCTAPGSPLSLLTDVEYDQRLTALHARREILHRTAPDSAQRLDGIVPLLDRQPSTDGIHADPASWRFAVHASSIVVAMRMVGTSRRAVQPTQAEKGPRRPTLTEPAMKPASNSACDRTSTSHVPWAGRGRAAKVTGASSVGA
jgi:hypothetical protein